MNPFTSKRFKKVTLTSLLLLATAGCGGGLAADEQPVVDDVQAEDTWDAAQQATLASTAHGSFLFTLETFNGNGRTCATCHTLSTGTLSPAQAQARFAKNPKDPLFRALDSDDGSGKSYSKLLNDATVMVEIPLPPHVRLAANPTARTIKLRRGIPSTFDSPRFDPVLMLDGREPTLASQAHGAIMGHAEAKRTPTATETSAIADFEQWLFSSKKMLDYAVTGKAPALPAGSTASEKRGRALFLPTGLCGSCHGGPMLNQVPENPFGTPPGTRFMSVGVSEVNMAGNPVHEFIITLPDGSEITAASPDPGRFLITGNPDDFNAFRMTSLWNIKNTAPYFHDNSAKTLEAVVFQYKLLFDFIGLPFSEQDMADAVAYMKLL
jgi:cytochrome c peroxidase